MEFGAQLLRHRRVRDVPDQHVVEAKAVVAGVAGAVGPDELLPHEREQDRADAGPVPVLEQRGDRAAMEQAPLHRRPLEGAAFVGLEPVDARGEERVDRRRHLVLAGPRIVGQHREHLLDEERVALGRLDDPPAEPGRQVVLPEQRVDEAVRLDRLQRLELDERSAQVRRSPRRAARRTDPGGRGRRSGSGRRSRSRRGTRAGRATSRRPSGRRRRRGPAAGLTRASRRAGGTPRPSPPASPPRRIPRLRRRSAAPRRRRARTSASSRTSSGRGSSPATSRTTSREREVRDPLPVREAAADEDARPRLERADQLAREPRLADPRRADDRRELAASPSATAASNALVSRASSARLPTNGVRIGCANAGTSGLTATSRQAATGSLLPFASIGSTASATTASRTSPYVSEPISTSPGAAACSRRAATLTASPVASRWSAAEPAPPTITSPVLTPVRVTIRTPCSRSASSFRRSSASRSSTTARTARTASSSWTTGTPKTAITASPMNFSTVPPCRTSTACAVAK